MTIQEHDGDDDVRELAPTDREEADPDAPDSEEEFAEEVRDLVASSVPRVFALVEERGVRADGRILYWGLEFDDEDCADEEARAVIISTGSYRRGGSFSSAESAQQTLSRRKKIRLVWTSTTATRAAEELAN